MLCLKTVGITETSCDWHTHTHTGIPAVCWLSRHHCWPPKGHLCLSLLLASLLPETQQHCWLVSCWNWSRWKNKTKQNNKTKAYKTEGGHKQEHLMENYIIFVFGHHSSLSFFISPLNTTRLLTPSSKQPEHSLYLPIRSKHHMEMSLKHAVYCEGQAV